MAKHNKTGRRKTGPPFVQLYRYMLESPAWRSLSPQARAVYIEVAALYNGSNNGSIGLGARAAAERANVNKDTATKCFRVLVERGFLEAVRAGAFNQNDCKATEWRLTTHKCDLTHQLPSKAFMRWSPENAERRPKRGPPPSETRGLEPEMFPASVPRFRTIKGGLA